MSMHAAGSSPPIPFGALLRRHRIAAGLTQEELAERAGISVRRVGDFERGVRQMPRRDTVALLATALNLSAQEQAAFMEAARRVEATAPALPTSRGAATPPFVGRTSELALLERHLAGQGPPLLLFAGEPGIGKTRLLHAAVPRAVTLGYRVLEGGCQRRGGHEPYAPLLGALQQYLRGRQPAELRTALRGCAWLVRLLPELAAGPIEPLPAWTLPPEQERRLMVAAVLRFLANVAGPAGTLLVLDDLQWAGPDALDLLVTLVRTAGDVPLRLIAAYRDIEVQPRGPLAEMLADLAHARVATHRILAPLDVNDAAQLLDHLLREADDTGAAPRERLLERADGVPFFLVSCVQGLRDDRAETGRDRLPWDLAQSIRQRVAALPERAQQLLGAAAIVGRIAPRALLVEIAGQTDEAVQVTFETACQARLLEEQDEHTYRFTHDVIREVVEADLGAARRLLLHRRVAAAIEAVYAHHLADHYETLAYHYQCGEAWQKALHYLEQSGDKAASANAVREALRFYDQALAVCERLGEPARETAAGVAEKRAFVCFGASDFGQAAADFARMNAIARSLVDRRREGMALAHQGMAEFYAHDFGAAERSLRAAIETAEGRYDETHFLASALLADLLITVNRHMEAMPLRSMAEELAARVNDSFSQAYWSGLVTAWLHWSGRFEDACTYAQRTRSVIEARGEILTVLISSWFEALAYGGKGDYEQALARLHKLLATCQSIGDDFLRPRILNTIGWIYAEIQDHRQAASWNSRSLDVIRASGTDDTEILNNVLLNLGEGLMALGQFDEAEEHFRAVEQVVRNPRSHDHWVLWRYAQRLFHNYGELWFARGDLARAIAYADECLAMAISSESRKNIVKAWRLRGQVYLAQSQIDEAETALNHALELAREVGNPPQLWKTLLSVRDLRWARSDHAGASHAHNEARSVIESVAARLSGASLRATFLASDHIQSIIQR
jgi:tetratricopeptide (TPR) repeat protein/transcriptional regulator with XRE-family HTH domain